MKFIIIIYNYDYLKYLNYTYTSKHVFNYRWRWQSGSHLPSANDKRKLKLCWFVHVESITANRITHTALHYR